MTTRELQHQPLPVRQFAYFFCPPNTQMWEQDALMDDIPHLDLGPPLVPFNDQTYNASWTAVLERPRTLSLPVRRRSFSPLTYVDHRGIAWIEKRFKKRNILTSNVTDDVFVLGTPNDSALVRRRKRDAFDHIHWIDSVLEPDSPVSPPWGFTSIYVESTPHGSPTSLEPLIPEPPSLQRHALVEPSRSGSTTPSVSSNRLSEKDSLKSFIQYLASIAQQRQPPASSPVDESDDFTDFYDAEEAVIEEASVATSHHIPPRPAIPARRTSLHHLSILNAGLASQSRRGRSTSPEVRSARQVRLYRLTPVKLVIVRGRVVALDDRQVDVPWASASVPEERQEFRRHKIWAKMKAKLGRKE